MKITWKMISNLLFIIALALVIYPTSRAWIMRQVAFAPSIENKEDRLKLSNYNWELKGINTPDYNLLDAQNKVVIVNLWATWCPPCIAEMPSLQNLYNDYGDQVVFLFVTSEDASKVTSFLENNNFNLPVYNNASRTPELLASRSIPATYLIDKKGDIVIYKIGAANWNSTKVRKLLDELLTPPQ